MIEHVIRDDQDLKLLEIYPDGVCFLRCVSSFLEMTEVKSLQEAGQGGAAKLGMMCVCALSDEKQVKHLLKIYKKELHLENTEEIGKSIVKEAKDLNETIHKEKPKSAKESEKFIEKKLCNIWNTMLAEWFQPMLCILLQISIVIWGLELFINEREGGLLITGTYHPGGMIFDTCNILWCLTNEGKPHFELLIRAAQEIVVRPNDK